MPTIEGLRSYARLNPDDNDPSLQVCFDAAIQHAKDAGVPDWLFTANDGTGDAKLNLYLYAMAANLYDNRGFELPNGVSSTYIEGCKRQMRVELKYRVKGAELGGETV